LKSFIFVHSESKKLPLIKNNFYTKLSQTSALREQRQATADIVMNDLSLLPELIQITFMVNDKTSCRAAWVLEFVCRQNLNLIIPHLNTFTENISKVHFDSAIRPMAKTCELLTIAHYSKKETEFKIALKSSHKEKIVEACFDWMINDEKVAPKAYAMQALYLLGKEYDWIHTELIMILEHDFHNQSSGFKARAKHLIKEMKR